MVRLFLILLETPSESENISTEATVESSENESEIQTVTQTPEISSEEEKIPKTGDNYTVYLFLALLVVSSSAIVIIYRNLKNNANTK